MKLSIIVPAYREGREAALWIQKLSRNSRVFEVIASAFDCSSSFMRLLRRVPKTRLLEAVQRGRGFQMNYGAAVARGDLLLFLHADTRLKAGGLEEMTESMRQSQWVGGAFRLKFDRLEWHYHLKAWGGNTRSRVLGMPYGDQGFFVRQGVFKRLGGFRDLPLFEDVEFFDRLKKEGPWILLRSSAITSARRWEKQGYWKATLKNALWIFLYRLGVSPFWLAKKY